MAPNLGTKDAERVLRTILKDVSETKGTGKIHKDIENQHLKKLKIHKISSQKHNDWVISDPK